MSGINKIVTFAVNRIRVNFADSLDKKTIIRGTGFWVELLSKRRIFVTNKHIIDPSLKFGPNTDYELKKIEIELRKRSNQQYFAETQFFEVKNPSESSFPSLESDCALVIPNNLDEIPEEFKPVMVISQSDLADQSFFSEKVQIMDFSSFIGFPGKSTSGWWDQTWNLPIARFASIASWPEITFSNESIKTSDVTLVTGLSFSGSSGSPIILHEKGVNPGPGLENPSYVGPKVLGIMSGHWWDDNKINEMFRHSGLSFYTRSTAILKLLSINNL